jgi:membrane protein DedA with SNARE-associated domain
MEQWIIDVVTAFGYVGIFLLMLGENIFPPIPSEVILPVTGVAVGAGELSFVAAALVALAGTLIGNLPWFFVARWIGRERVMHLAERWGRYAAIRPDDVAHAIAWFDRHGVKAVLIGRFAPGVRTLISVPAGLSGMPFPQFLLLSAIGSTIWIVFLLSVGIVLRNSWHAISGIVGTVGTVLVLGLVLALAVFLVWRHWHERRAPR